MKLSRALRISTDYLLTGCRNSVDHTAINGRLDEASPEKYDKIMRIIDIVLEE